MVAIWDDDIVSSAEMIANRITTLTGRTWSTGDVDRLTVWLGTDSNLDDALEWLAATSDSVPPQEESQRASLLRLRLQKVLSGSDASESGFSPPT